MQYAYILGTAKALQKNIPKGALEGHNCAIWWYIFMKDIQVWKWTLLEDDTLLSNMASLTMQISLSLAQPDPIGSPLIRWGASAELVEGHRSQPYFEDVWASFSQLRPASHDVR